MRSFYDILGVRPDVGQAELRAAYIAMMKRHHPDAAEDTAGEASEINRAFFALRDPVRRAMHDHDLARARRSAGQATLRRVQETRVALPPRRRRRGRRAAASFVLVGLTGAVTYLLLHPEAAEQLRAEHLSQVGVLPTPITADPAPVTQPVVLPGHVSGAVLDFDLILASAGIEEAESYSRQCFREFDAAPNPRMFDHCIAFDTLGGIWHQANRGEEEDGSFFAARAKAQRLDAGRRRLGLSEQLTALRTAEIERMTMAEMATRLRR